MRAITFTQEELALIREDIDSSLEYVDECLVKGSQYEFAEEREKDIQMALALRSILAKIDDSKHWLK